MNLRHIDEILSRHSAGWNPFKGDFRISKSSFKSSNLKEGVGGVMGWTPLTGFGAFNSMAPGWGKGPLTDVTSSGADAVGFETPVAKAETKAADMASSAAASAAERQALFDAASAEGLARLALKKKRGFGSSMIVQQAATLGNPSTLGA